MDLNDMAVCPDCKQGKHDNCDGGAWNEEEDRPGPCRCWAENHELSPA